MFDQAGERDASGGRLWKLSSRMHEQDSPLCIFAPTTLQQLGFTNVSALRALTLSTQHTFCLSIRVPVPRECTLAIRFAVVQIRKTKLCLRSLRIGKILPRRVYSFQPPPNAVAMSLLLHSDR
jgi:hypothetical protein